MATITITCRAILSDLDGTLIDSTTCVDTAWETWAQNHQLDVGWVRKNAHGMRTADSLKILVPDLDHETEIKKLEDLECGCITNLNAVPGAEALLASLATGMWAIVTSGSSRLANHRLGHVGLPRPPVFVTADHVSTGKPEPQCYLLAASQLGVLPGDCVVLEDSPAGIKAGKGAGARVIAVSAHSQEHDLSSADFIVEDLTRLKVAIGDDGLMTLNVVTAQ